MFRRITAAASRLLRDGADGGFYGLESLNAWVRSMVPTHPALVLLWCQILLLVSHTDYRWWAEVQQTPKYVRSPPGRPARLLCAARSGRSSARSSRGVERFCSHASFFPGHHCREMWFDCRHSKQPLLFTRDFPGKLFDTVPSYGS